MTDFATLQRENARLRHENERLRECLAETIGNIRSVDESAMRIERRALDHLAEIESAFD